jgi:alkane 1-monooxygenase
MVWPHGRFFLYAFVAIPFIELFLPTDKTNLTEEEEKVQVKNRFFDWMVYIIVPAQWGLVGLFLFALQQELSAYELIGKIVTLGIACGIFGINVGHELGHRSTKHEQWMAKALLLTSQYMHFFIEHNRGHHKNVSTENDPATSRYGEWVYTFWFRSIIFGYISAWKIEFNRLKKKRLPKFHWSNNMIHYSIIQVAMLVTIFLLFSWQVMLFYLVAAFIGILLLETVNYIEHYGLKRQMNEKGALKKVLPIHSWNSDHPLGRGILFELSRHSDHHYLASRKYQILRHFDDSPQLPTGYPGMIILALFPPVWFGLMNPRVKKLQQEYPLELA